jgi:(p)ppGpp synthase/HD superfamily hydrolase
MTVDKLLLSKRFDNALLWAVNCHSKQYRKGTGIPYISHLLAVVAIVMENTLDEDVVIGALLHDAAEDQGGQIMLEKIRFAFGEKVADIVAGCTDAWVIPKPEWLPRKENYIQSLPKHSEDTQLVSLADKLHNIRAILHDYRIVGERLWERFSAGKEGTLWYYRELVKTFKTIANKKHELLVTELDEVVSEVERISR